ncbi:uncharacterized protein BDW47DRAFT_114178 [Aspergillus candidus]|uniref:Uncharacterized protein n=1 Tax=Aspergillus candidus TaxID=41067 RepID=A0A2I2EY96_ASPCN|nr:hypothetical protein BDW47DRAFT_114178 [Aspergillus candidus]PLB33351.1 hypothetical protein BDW47DRAFT_114178 [Aspergillus candidus]
MTFSIRDNSAKTPGKLILSLILVLFLFLYPLSISLVLLLLSSALTLLPPLSGKCRRVAWFLSPGLLRC